MAGNCLLRISSLPMTALDKLARWFSKQRAYRADTAAAALKAGRIARESMVKKSPSGT